MDVASLVKECNELGPPVDMIEVSKECLGCTPAQVLQLRLEHLLFQRRLAKAEGRSREVEGKMVRRNEEIKKLKAKIRILMGRDSGGSAVQTAEEEYETFDWTTGGQTYILGNEEEPDDGAPSSILGGSTLGEESVIGHQDVLQKGSGTAMQIVAQSGCGEEEFGSFLLEFGTDSVASNGDDIGATLESQVQSDNVNVEMEDDSSSSSSDCVLISEPQRIPLVEGGRSQVATSTLPPPDVPRGLGIRRKQRRIPAPPCSTLANHSDSDVEVSSGEDEGAEQKSGGPTVAVVNTGKRFACLHCPQTFNSNNNLVLHRFRKHLNEPGIFKCDQCRRAFLSKEDLERHNRLRHRPASERQTFKCKHCPKMFSSRKHCLEHEKMHDGISGKVERAKCDLCSNKSYATYRGLKKHNKRVHPQLK